MSEARPFLRRRGILFFAWPATADKAGNTTPPPAPRDWLRLVGIAPGKRDYIFAPVGLHFLIQLWFWWTWKRWCLEDLAARWGFLVGVENGGRYDEGRWTWRFWEKFERDQVKAVARALARGEANERARICDIIDRKYFDVTIATESEHQSVFAGKVIRLLGELWKEQVKPDLINAINAPKNAVPIFPAVRKGNVALIEVDEDGPEIIGRDGQWLRQDGSGSGIILP